MQVLFLIAALVATTLAAVPADQITTLPGWTQPLPSNQYSGYLTFGAKHIHYWFVEAENSPSTAPVVAWFNGGPGCSSLEGYLYEHGPFHVNPSNPSQLYYNNYTWTTVANVLYLEAPVGVGFSYSDNTADYTTSDLQVADDNLAALEVFFASYPEFASNDFYITGESYAGVYVPTLAYAIYNATKLGLTQINLKGFMVGNGCTGNAIGVCSPAGEQIRIQYCYDHGLFSTAAYEQILAACEDFQVVNTPACNAALNAASAEIGAINIYDILGPCINNPTESRSTNSYTKAPGVHRVGGPDECIDSIAANFYLNQPIVQSALHVIPASYGNWSVCGNSLSYTSTVENEPATIYPELIANYRVWIYNGDVDACVPYTDNEAWTAGMGYPVKEAWHPWLVDSQVAGYSTVYAVNGFSFVTVKGAGHMVPQYQPAAALAMFQSFLAGKNL